MKTNDNLMDFDKIRNKITDKKKKELYTKIYSHGKDYMLLSKNKTYHTIKDMLYNNVNIICNLKDRDGIIGEPILYILENNIEQECFKILMKRNISHKLCDRYLYNIIFNELKNKYYLEEHDEYFEKIKTE